MLSDHTTSPIQQRIELGPDVVLLGARDMAVGAFRHWPHLGGRVLWLMMIEVEVAPAAGFGETLGVLHGHVGAVEGTGEIAAAGKLGSRTVGVHARQSELQLLEEDRAFGKDIRLLVDL